MYNVILEKASVSYKCYVRHKNFNRFCEIISEKKFSCLFDAIIYMLDLQSSISKDFHPSEIKGYGGGSCRKGFLSGSQFMSLPKDFDGNVEFRHIELIDISGKFTSKSIK